MKQSLYRFLSHITTGKIAYNMHARYKLLRKKSADNLLKKLQTSGDIFCLNHDTQTQSEIQNIQFRLNQLEQQTNEKFEIYETGGEWFRNNFDEYLSQDLTDKYLAMIKDLDDESKQIFDTILRRLVIAKQNGWENTYFHASNEEKHELMQIQNELYNKIIPLGNDWYACNGFVIPSNNLEPGIWHYHHFINEIEDLKKIKSGNIIDAGGYIGDSAVVLADYTDKKVYSFEPHPKHIELMEKVIAKNKCDKIVPVMKGLGDKEDTMYMPDTISMGNTLTSKADGVPVEVTTLDKFVKENNLQVSLLKIDIEGFESYLLNGAIETIKSQKPALLISIYHNGHDFFEIKPWIENLNLGYKFKIRKAWDCNTNRDTLLICEVR